jgi:hypothetical protein
MNRFELFQNFLSAQAVQLEETSFLGGLVKQIQGGNGGGIVAVQASDQAFETGQGFSFKRNNGLVMSDDSLFLENRLDRKVSRRRRSQDGLDDQGCPRLFFFVTSYFPSG